MIGWEQRTQYQRCTLTHFETSQWRQETFHDSTNDDLTSVRRMVQVGPVDLGHFIYTHPSKVTFHCLPDDYEVRDLFLSQISPLPVTQLLRNKKYER
jgi:hypothetical protein